MTEFLNSDTMRWVNVAAASVVVSLLIAGTMCRWEEMPPRIRRIVPWVILTYVIVAYGHAEIAWSTDHPPEGYRLILSLLNLCGLIIALVYGFSDDDYDEE